MTTEMSELLTAAAARTVPVVRGIADDQLDSPTPCADFQVRDLLNHLFQVVINMQAMAERKPGDFRSTPDVIKDDWRDRFATETERLIAAWSDPAALEGVSAGMGLPQPMIAGLALADLTVHGWDLARATGQPYEPDPVVVAHLRPQVEQMAPQGRAMGAFGEPAPVAPDASDFEQLLAITGRSSSSR
jgi:uncharacterized protein (TIGR03086 family)